MNGLRRLSRALRRPEYLYRPSQIARRLRYSLRPPRGRVWTETPWGLPMLVDADELHGRAMLTLGVMDLRVSEILWRLIEPGDHVVDVGANIGTLTGIMAWRTGPNGKVTAFEPHPETRAILEESVTRWRELRCADVTVFPYALSATCGKGYLEEPPQFTSNSGVACLTDREKGDSGHEVEVRTFDSLLSRSERFKIVKIDVEGHEDDVVAGMIATLGSSRIDHVVFEEFRPLPSPLCRTLAGYDFTAFLIERDLHGPRLVPVEEQPKRTPGETPNIYATRDMSVIDRLAQPGWQCLHRDKK